MLQLRNMEEIRAQLEVDKAELYTPNIDLRKLHLVDVTTCPSDFKDNKKHHIFFGFPSMGPVCCSEPVPGNSIKAEELAKALAVRQIESPHAEARRLLDCITQLRKGREERIAVDSDLGNYVDPLLQAVTIVRVESKADA